VPLIHNLHNFVFGTDLANIPIRYYVNLYYFMFASLHSFAPMVGFIGCFLLVKGRAKAFLSIPIAYELYKTIEKIPFVKTYTIHNEFFTASAGFVVSFWMLTWYLTGLKQDLRQKEFEKYLDNTIKELNLK
jgi:hypothetical protein